MDILINSGQISSFILYLPYEFESYIYKYNFGFMEFVQTWHPILLLCKLN